MLFRSLVPLRKDGALLGAISAYSREVRPFTDKQISLLQNFAAQAVIAMENARLLTETREALEQQTATAEVLQVINTSPGDLAPVFDIILEKAHVLCGAAFGALGIYYGEQFRVAAAHGVADFTEYEIRVRSDGNSPLERLTRGERLVHVTDVRTEDAYGDLPAFRSDMDRHNIRTLLLVPLRKDWALLGAYQRLQPGSAAVHRQANRAVAEFRRAGGHRDGECAAIDRDARGIGTADRHC